MTLRAKEKSLETTKTKQNAAGGAPHTPAEPVAEVTDDPPTGNLYLVRELVPGALKNYGTKLYAGAAPAEHPGTEPVAGHADLLRRADAWLRGVGTDDYRISYHADKLIRDLAAAAPAAHIGVDSLP